MQMFPGQRRQSTALNVRANLCKHPQRQHANAEFLSLWVSSDRKRTSVKQPKLDFQQRTKVRLQHRTVMTAYGEFTDPKKTRSAAATTVLQCWRKRKLLLSPEFIILKPCLPDDTVTQWWLHLPLSTSHSTFTCELSNHTNPQGQMTKKHLFPVLLASWIFWRSLPGRALTGATVGMFTFEVHWAQESMHPIWSGNSSKGLRRLTQARECEWMATFDLVQVTSSATRVH